MEEYRKELLHTMIRPSREDEIILDINPYSKDVIHNTFLFTSTQYFDFDWFKTSLQYTKDLSYYDKYTLKSYTSNGDMLINKYLRENTIIHTDYIVFAVQLFKIYGELTDVYFTYDNTLSEEGILKANEIMMQNKLDILRPDCNHIRLKSVIQNYIDDLRNIVLNAPVCSKDLLVFRGVSDDYIHDNKWVQLKGFQSTSYSIDAAVPFRKSSIYEVIIQKNTPCVAMEYISRHSREKEILICDNISVKADDSNKKYTLDSIHLYTEDGKYVEWEYILNKILDPSNDIEPDNGNNINNISLIPKQIENTKRIYCNYNIHNQRGGRNINTTRKNVLNIRKNILNTRNITRKNKYTTVESVGTEDMKSRFRDPILIGKVCDRLPEKQEREFYEFLMRNRAEHLIPDYLKELYSTKSTTRK